MCNRLSNKAQVHKEQLNGRFFELIIKHIFVWWSKVVKKSYFFKKFFEKSLTSQIFDAILSVHFNEKSLCNTF